MAYPRDEIVDKLIKPINSSAVRMDSLLIFPSEPGYADMVKQSGVSKYTKGTQAEREAAALALVRKHSASNVKVNLLWGTPSNARRAASAQIVKAALGRAGFDVNAPGVVAWSSQLDSSAWDAEFFAWVKSSVTQQGIQIYSALIAETCYLATATRLLMKQTRSLAHLYFPRRKSSINT